MINPGLNQLITYTQIQILRRNDDSSSTPIILASPNRSQISGPEHAKDLGGIEALNIDILAVAFRGG